MLNSKAGLPGGGGRVTRNTAGGKDEKQPKIDDKFGRRVSFEDKKEWEELKSVVLSEVKKIRQERTELGKLKIEIDNRLIEMSEKIEGLEKRLGEIENKETEREEWKRRMLSVRSEEDSEGGPGEGAAGSQWSLYSERSKYSACSAVSRLSEREIKMMKRFVGERDRRERENNVVIRGAQFKTENLREQVETFLEDKLEVKGKVEATWFSGKVVVAKLSREMKVEVMKNKNKLAGSRVYIENDLTFEERKRQEEMYTWAKEKRDLGFTVKAGQGRIFFKGTWYRWEEKEKIEGEMENSLKKLERPGKGGERGDERREDFA